MRPLCDSWASGFARCLIILQRYLSPADFLPMHLYACLWLVRVKQKASLFRDTVSTDLHIISSQQTPAYTVTQCTRLLPCFRWYSYSYPQKDGQAKLTWVATGWLYTEMVCHLQTVTHPSTNPAWRTGTLLVKTNAYAKTYYWKLYGLQKFVYTVRRKINDTWMKAGWFV